MKSDPISLLISLGAGIMVGVIYSLVKIPSPAPPLFALLGLFGILLGSQIIPTVTKHVAATPAQAVRRFAASQQHRSHVPPIRQGGDLPAAAPAPPAIENKI